MIPFVSQCKKKVFGPVCITWGCIKLASQPGAVPGGLKVQQVNLEQEVLNCDRCLQQTIIYLLTSLFYSNKASLASWCFLFQCVWLSDYSSFLTCSFLKHKSLIILLVMEIKTLVIPQSSTLHVRSYFLDFIFDAFLFISKIIEVIVSHVGPTNLAH